MSARFLLIAGNAETQWARTLQEALSPLGALHVVPATQPLELAPHFDGELIVIDAGEVMEFETAVQLLRRRFPGVHVVVATASPTWQRARQALQAGASDYIRKSFDARQLRNQMTAILNTGLPPCPKE